MSDLKQIFILSMVVGVIFSIGLMAISSNADGFKTEYCTPDYCLKEGQTLEQIGVN